MEQREEQLNGLARSPIAHCQNPDCKLEYTDPCITTAGAGERQGKTEDSEDGTEGEAVKSAYPLVQSPLPRPQMQPQTF